MVRCREFAPLRLPVLNYALALPWKVANRRDRVRRIRRVEVKQGIHPEYKPSRVTCACGNTFETKSTKGDINVEICSDCHPFFTGKQKFVDSEGRVDRFNRKYGRKS
jgi:large subunit ribosomal protein L31